MFVFTPTTPLFDAAPDSVTHPTAPHFLTFRTSYPEGRSAAKAVRPRRHHSTSSMSNLPKRAKPLADSGPHVTPTAIGCASPPRSPIGCAQPPNWGWSFHSSLRCPVEVPNEEIQDDRRSTTAHSLTAIYDLPCLAGSALLSGRIILGKYGRAGSASGTSAHAGKVVIHSKSTKHTPPG